MNTPELNELVELLKVPLPTDNPMALMEALAMVECWQPIVSLRYREAEANLALVRNRFYDPSLGTVDHRKIALESATRKEEQLQSELCDIADIIKRRVSLGQTLLRNHQTEAQSGLR